MTDTRIANNEKTHPAPWTPDPEYEIRALKEKVELNRAGLLWVAKELGGIPVDKVIAGATKTLFDERAAVNRKQSEDQSEEKNNGEWDAEHYEKIVSDLLLDEYLLLIEGNNKPLRLDEVPCGTCGELLPVETIARSLGHQTSIGNEKDLRECYRREFSNPAIGHYGLRCGGESCYNLTPWRLIPRSR